jgi:ribosome-associated protein
MATDCVVLKVRKLTSVSDYIVICSADSVRQVQAISSSINDGLRSQKERPMCVEGYDTASWILMDYNDVVAHVFMPETRELYDLDGLWADAEKIDVPATNNPPEASGDSATDSETTLV